MTVLPVGKDRILEDARSVYYLECTLQAQEQQSRKHICHPRAHVANVTAHEARAGLDVSAFGLQWTLSKTEVGSDLGLSLPRGCKDRVLLKWGACWSRHGAHCLKGWPSGQKSILGQNLEEVDM